MPGDVAYQVRGCVRAARSCGTNSLKDPERVIQSRPPSLDNNSVDINITATGKMSRWVPSVVRTYVYDLHLGVQMPPY